MPEDTRFRPQRETSRVKAQIKKLEKDRERLLPELGRASYAAHLERGLSDPALNEFFAQLASIDAQIAQGQAEIQHIQEVAAQLKAAAASPQVVTTVCQFCGSALNAGAKFCANCGHVMAQPAQPAAPSAVQCSTCGTVVTPGTKFCANCGAPAGFAPQARPPAPAAPPPPAAAPPPPPPAAAAPAASVPGATVNKCPSCGAYVEEADAEFCGECGTSL